MLWAKISDGAVNLEEVQGITINERVEGKFVLVILFKNGQIEFLRRMNSALMNSSSTTG
ncbi:MAG: hypothetical protein NZ937_06460 [Armatimonadetes bacterium]|nr:hypothetical protein [Armatimonadota bacterium]